MFRVFLLFYFSLFASAAFAADYDPVPIPHSGTVGPSWSSPKVTDEYKKVVPKTSEIVKGLGEVRKLLYQYMLQEYDFARKTPYIQSVINNVKFLGEMAGLNWLSKTGIKIKPDIVETIARFCENKYASTKDQISCAAYNTDKYVKQPGFYYIRPIYDGDNVDCRTVNFMFQLVLKAMKFANSDQVYPRSRMMAFKYQDGKIEPHVVTLVTITNDFHQSTYAIDAGFLPLSFYPYGPATEAQYGFQ